MTKLTGTDSYSPGTMTEIRSVTEKSTDCVHRTHHMTSATKTRGSLLSSKTSQLKELHTKTHSCPAPLQLIDSSRLQHIRLMRQAAVNLHHAFHRAMNKAMTAVWQEQQRRCSWPGAERRLQDGVVGGGSGCYKANRGSVLTRSGCFGLNTRLGSDFFPTDNDSDNDCW